MARRVHRAKDEMQEGAGGSGRRWKWEGGLIRAVGGRGGVRSWGGEGCPVWDRGKGQPPYITIITVGQ